MQPHSPLPSFETIKEAFSFLDDWEERYAYLLELGKKLPAFPENARNPENQVKGCVSTVWLLTSIISDVNAEKRLHIQADSDAFMVRGLIAILLSLFHNKSLLEVLEIDVSAKLAELDLKSHLSEQRSNGLRAMVLAIKTRAAQA